MVVVMVMVMARWVCQYLLVHVLGSPMWQVLLEDFDGHKLIGIIITG